MKKFIFSLQSVFEYKQTVEKQRRRELKKAQDALRILRQEEQRLEDSFLENSKALGELLEKGAGIKEALPKYDAYFRYLRDAKEELQVKIDEAEAVKTKCMAELITTMKEIEVYSDLREEQLNRYLAEVRAEEEKEMGDIVSFQVISAQ